MEATVGGSGGIPLDPSLEGRREEPEEMETGVPVATRDRDETGARTRKREDRKNIFSKD